VEIYDAPGDLELVLPLDPAAIPGSVIDVEELTIDGAVGQRILYHSTSAQGDIVAVSGFVAFPEGDAPDGGWPLIAWAHGTTGLGDTCAPSNNAENDQLARALVGFGYAVVATDFEGLGTPGIHPYIVGASEAHGVLDSVRAVYELGLPVTDEWIVFGHSQGGHAAMFTGQLQSTYAPELKLIGVVAGAPPSQMGDLGDALIGSDFQGYLIMTAAGLAAANPDLDLADVLSADAISLIGVVETGCTEDIFEVYNPLDYDDVTIVDNPFVLPDWAAAVKLNDTNLLPVTVPLLIIHGGEDEQIPVETSATLLDQLCKFPDQGPTVRNVYEGQSHAGVLTTFAAVPDLLAWVAGRFAGDIAPSMCS
jgi:pimeloyl-ACP methyl ester carboxylesterase